LKSGCSSTSELLQTELEKWVQQHIRTATN